MTSDKQLESALFSACTALRRHIAACSSPVPRPAIHSDPSVLPLAQTSLGHPSHHVRLAGLELAGALAETHRHLLVCSACRETRNQDDVVARPIPVSTATLDRAELGGQSPIPGGSPSKAVPASADASQPQQAADLSTPQAESVQPTVTISSADETIRAAQPQPRRLEIAEHPIDESAPSAEQRK